MDIDSLAEAARLGSPWTFPGKEREWHATREQLRRFAEIVAAQEREECARFVESCDAKTVEFSACPSLAAAIRMRYNER